MIMLGILGSDREISLPESTSIFASSRRSFVSADLIASTLISFRSQLEMCTEPIDVIEFERGHRV